MRRMENHEEQDTEQVTIRVPASVMRRLREMAGAQERSVSGEIRLALREYVGERSDV